MTNLIYCYDEETYKTLVKRGFTLLKGDFEKCEFCFLNNKPNECFENISKKVMFSNRMTF